MHIVGKSLYAIGKLYGVGDYIVLTVASALPQVVDKDVFVAGIAKTAFHHSVGSLTYK